MELNVQTHEDSKKFVSELQSIADRIRDDEFPIDGSFETFKAVQTMIVKMLGAEMYERASQGVGVCLDEKSKVLFVIQGVVNEFDQINRMNESTLGILGSFGVTGIKWV